MKKKYIIPRIDFQECDDLMDVGIYTSRTWDDTEGAKGSFVDTEFEEEDPLLPTVNNHSGTENVWK